MPVYHLKPGEALTVANLRVTVTEIRPDGTVSLRIVAPDAIPPVDLRVIGKARDRGDRASIYASSDTPIHVQRKPSDPGEE